MKKCPQCNRTYSDDTLAYCPEDAALLSIHYDATEVFPPNAAAQTEAPTVRWYVYLLGFVTSLLVYELEIYLIFPLYSQITKELVLEIGDKFEILTDAGTMIAATLVMMPVYLITVALLGFIFGYLWSKTNVKWGVILVLPYLFYRLYYFVNFLLDDEGTALVYFILSVVMLFIMLVTAGYFSILGSRLNQSPKATH